MMKSKARILIDASDVLFKTVLTHRVAPSDATLIAFKILEVLHHPVPILHYIIYVLAQSICTLISTFSDRLYIEKYMVAATLFF